MSLVGDDVHLAVLVHVSEVDVVAPGAGFNDGDRPLRCVGVRAPSHRVPGPEQDPPPAAHDDVVPAVAVDVHGLSLLEPRRGRAAGVRKDDVWLPVLRLAVERWPVAPGRENVVVAVVGKHGEGLGLASADIGDRVDGDRRVRRCRGRRQGGRAEQQEG